MKNLMLLHNRHTPDDSDIWRVAMRRGWNTSRCGLSAPIKDQIKGFDFVRYYGNTLNGAEIENQLPFKFVPIDYEQLAGKRLSYYTDRKIDYISFGELKQPIEQDCFIKPARDKWFEARIYKKGETVTGAPLADDKIYVSEIVNYIDEVRCFVLDGEILTSSYYRMNKVNYQEVDLPNEQINFDNELKDTEFTKIC